MARHEEASKRLAVYRNSLDALASRRFVMRSGTRRLARAGEDARPAFRRLKAPHGLPITAGWSSVADGVHRHLGQPHLLIPGIPMEGTVSSFLPEKGYGFVQGDDGRTYFLHKSDLADGMAALVDGQRLSFEESATPKGYRARRVQAASAATHAKFQVPTQVLHSRDSQVRGWETVEATLWSVVGSSRESPDDARSDMLAKARRLGANGIVLVQYFKTRGAEPGTGKRTHYFTIHHYRGHPVMLGRRSASGTQATEDLQGLAERATRLKQSLELATASSRRKAAVVASIVAGAALVAAAALRNFGGLFAVGFGLVLALVAYKSMAEDHDSWLVRL